MKASVINAPDIFHLPAELQHFTQGDTFPESLSQGLWDVQALGGLDELDSMALAKLAKGFQVKGRPVLQCVWGFGLPLATVLKDSAGVRNG